MNATGGDAVLYAVADRVATITIDRPEARNALNSEVLRLLPKYILEAEADDGVDVIILTGTDPAFSAGVDLKEPAAGGQGDADAAIGAVVESRQGPFPPHTKPSSGPSTAWPSPAASRSRWAVTSSSPPTRPASPTPTPGSGSCPAGG